MKKKFLSLVLVLSMLCAFVPVIHAAEIVDSGECGDNAVWTFDSEGTLTIKGTDEMWDYNSSSNTPWYNLEIKKVVIESEITYIGERSFYYLNSEQIKEVEIADTVTEIGSDAFSGCADLEKIVIPDSVTEIGSGVFSQCWSLSDITLSKNLTGIPPYAFRQCGLIDNLEIPEKVSVIGAEAFYHSSIRNITIPQSVMIIEEDAFSLLSNVIFTINGEKFEYDGVENVYYGGNKSQWENIKFIGDCDLLTSENIQYSDISYSGSCGNSVLWEIENKILKIKGTGRMRDYYPEYPLWFVYDYTAIEICDGVSYIGSYAFDEYIYDCYSSSNSFQKAIAKLVYIPKSVIGIEEGAFNKCPNLTDVYYEGTEKEWNNIKIDDFNTSLLDAEIHYSSAMPEISEPLNVSVSHSVVGNRVKFTVTPTEADMADELPRISLYVAEYDSNGVLISVQKGVNGSVNQDTMTITADLPSSGNYKFMLWDKNMCPLMDAITEI